MKFEITIEYSSNGNDYFNKEIEYEYYTDKKGKIFSDTIIYLKNKILITGERKSKIDIENCWSSTKSNYRRAIITSLLYLYNVVQESITINKIEIRSGKLNQCIPYLQEFQNLDKDAYKIPEELIINLFKKESNNKFSELLYKVLQSQILCSSKNDFFYSWKGFNSIYSFESNSQQKDTASKKKQNNETEEIRSLLKKYSSSELEVAINLAKEFVILPEDKMYKLIIRWINDEKSKVGSFGTRVGFEEYRYKNEVVKQVILKVAKQLYPTKKLSDLKLKGINSKNNEQDSDINYLQLVVEYAKYLRNKMYHGEHEINSFFIADINSVELKKISNIIFQLNKDILNSEKFINKNKEKQ